MNHIITKAISPSHQRIIWLEAKLPNLDFGDDLALLTNECEEMQSMTDSLKYLSKKVGLRISVDKSKKQKTGNIEDDADIFLEAA